MPRPGPLAGALERIVARACSAEPPPLRGAPLQRSAIADCRTDLLELADLLRSAAACSPRAAALVSFLVANPCSPLYNPEAPATPGSLARAAQTGFAPGSDGG